MDFSRLKRQQKNRHSMFVKIFQVSADKEKGKQSKLVQFSPQNLFQIHAFVISARKAKHLDITTVFA